nr:MAG TPA: hypothetical protein [Caudoviricetes sp.]
MKNMNNSAIDYHIPKIGGYIRKQLPSSIKEA